MSGNREEAKGQSVVSKEKQVGRVEDEEGEYYQKEKSVSVTRELHIKPINDTSASGSGNKEMDKEVVLRRIRQRKRVNKFQAALQALLSSPFSNTTHHHQHHNKRWLDHPFDAL